ncbi:MAG TPA: hypothetical protein VFE50_06940, partial [Cyclobacteriaceae bacterium]|nr:hypothetical protein [Cyclobacteriaceae bacterium]
LKLPDSRLGNNFRAEVEVEIPDQEYLQRNPPVVEVKFDVGEMVSAKQVIRLDTDKLPWGYVAQTDSISCTFLVPQKSYGKFIASELFGTLPTVRAESLKRGETGKFTPLVHGIPPYAEVVSVDSVSVKHF